MLPYNAPIFASYHPSEKNMVLPILEQIHSAGWNNIIISKEQTDPARILEAIKQSEMVLVFLSKAYACDERLMLERFAYTATVARRPFIPVWLDNLSDIQHDYRNTQNDMQLLSALEMLTAKNTGITPDQVIKSLEQYKPVKSSYISSKPQVCEKPCEAYEGNEPFIFVSYAHDDAQLVYPVVKDLYEAGWDLWYDEGIKISERYLPVIAHYLKHCSVFVLMLTNRCLERPFIMNYELEYAKQLGIPIITVLLEDLEPESLSHDTVAQLNTGAILPDELLTHVVNFNLKNRGQRKAVPPAVRQNVIYDIVLPPELPDFDFSVHGDEITITNFIGKEKKVVIPEKVRSPDGSLEFKIVRIEDYAFTGSAITKKMAVVQSSDFADTSHIGSKKIVEVTMPDSITSIGTGAFLGCKSLRSVKMSKNITRIGDNAFSGCKSLKSVELPSGLESLSVNLFSQCMSLKNFTIPKGVVSIEQSAFLWCSSLESISIPDSVTTIGDHAFLQCKKLNNLTIPDSVTSIGSYAFSRCKSLSKIVIPEKTIEIGDSAFEKTPAESTVLNKRSDYKKAPTMRELLSDLATAISESSPEDWKEDESIPQGEYEQECLSQLSVPKANDKPFAYVCGTEGDIEAISSLLIELYWEGFNIYCSEAPDLQKLDESSCVLALFSNDTSMSLETMNEMKRAVDRDTSRIVQVFIKGCSDWPVELKTELQNRQAIVQDLLSEQEFTGMIRDGLRQFGCTLGRLRGFDVKNMGRGAEVSRFNPTDFPHVIIPKTFFDPPLPTTGIGKLAFNGCDSVQSVKIPKSVTELGENAFRGCTSLISITLPDKIANVGVFAFGGCKSLREVRFPKSVVDKRSEEFALIDKSLRIGIRNDISNHVEFSSIISHKIFNGCERLNNIVIPQGVVSIGLDAFEQCKSLTNVIIPDSVTHVLNKAFAGCSSLAEIVLPDSITDISKKAFENCESLSFIAISNSVTHIAEDAFNGCDSLVIYTPEESAAWKYAKRKGIKCASIDTPEAFEKLSIVYSRSGDLLESMEWPDVAEIYREKAIEVQTRLYEGFNAEAVEQNKQAGLFILEGENCASAGNINEAGDNFCSNITHGQHPAADDQNSVISKREISEMFSASTDLHLLFQHVEGVFSKESGDVIFDGKNVFITDGITPKKIKNFQSNKSFNADLSGENPLMFIDDSLWGNGKSGFLLTEKAMYILQFLEKPLRLGVERITGFRHIYEGDPKDASSKKIVVESDLGSFKFSLIGVCSDEIRDFDCVVQILDGIIFGEADI